MKNTKLYTREQMIEAFKYGQNLKGFDCIGDMIDSLTPIELPSDEDIKNRANEYDFKLNQRFFTEGAKWVIEQLKQQSNGN